MLARATPLRAYTMRMFGIPESEIARSLREIEADGVELGAVEITTCLRRGEIEIDVRYRDGAEGVAEQVREGLARHHERYLFSTDGETIDAQVAGCCRAGGSGWPSRAAAGCWRRGSPASPGASEYMAGSVVAYANEAKSELLGVDPGLIERHGAVSPEVAEAMAVGALERFGADVAVSITGIAGPDGGTEEKPVGYVCFNARTADGDVIAREPVIPGSREDIRERSALVGMHLLRSLLGGAETPRLSRLAQARKARACATTSSGFSLTMKWPASANSTVMSSAWDCQPSRTRRGEIARSFSPKSRRVGTDEPAIALDSLAAEPALALAQVVAVEPDGGIGARGVAEGVGVARELGVVEGPPRRAPLQGADDEVRLHVQPPADARGWRRRTRTRRAAAERGPSAPTSAARGGARCRP